MSLSAKPAAEDVWTLTFMPWISMPRVKWIRFGDQMVTNAEAFLESVTDAAMLRTIRKILRMYRSPSGNKRAPAPINGIGIISLSRFPGDPREARRDSRLSRLQSALFLASLGQNARLMRTNGALDMRTADNFTVVQQRFGVDDDHFTENSGGRIVQVRNIGLSLESTMFLRNACVPSPYGFLMRDRLLAEMDFIERRKPGALDRVLRAVDVFREGYFNAHTHDPKAQLLLRVLAFEILLDLPPEGQRKHLKVAIESAFAADGLTKVRFKSPRRHGVMAWETASLVGYWADLFYRLRNRIIHGQTLRNSDWVFRGRQHHLLASTVVFIALVERVIAGTMRSLGAATKLGDTLRWGVIEPADAYTPETTGFELRFGIDWLGAAASRPMERTRDVTERMW